MTRAGAKALASEAIVELEKLLQRAPPVGTMAADVVGFFGRHRQQLVKALALLLREFTRQPLCSICRQPRGTNPDCDRCASFRWMRDNPLTAEERAEIADQLKRDEQDRQESKQLRAKRFGGRLVLVGLVGCGKTKAATAREAKDLYVGPLFRAARAYAENFLDEWVILSAFHHVLTPEQIVEPYDRTLSEMRDSGRHAWGHSVSSWLNGRYHGWEVRYVGLAGGEYLENLRLDAPIETPLRGMGIGARLKFLRDAVSEAQCGCVPQTARPKGRQM